MEFFKGKTVLVTGAAGTVGHELARQLGGMELADLRLMDNNETELFFLSEEFRGRANCFLGDVRDLSKLTKLCSGVDVVLHAAAFKHVILCEYNPFDAVQTNILGVENVIKAATANDVGHVIFTSSDKAVNPTNVMGTSKLMGERLISAANTVQMKNKTVFSSTRFGNVIGSRGSVVPIFMRQIKAGNAITLTDERMTRFIMTIDEAARLVLASAPRSRGGEVFVTKMPVVTIKDLAVAMIEDLAPHYGHIPADIKINVIGAKPGEKLYEELMSEEEVSRSLELSEMFVVVPAFKSLYSSIDYSYADLVTDKVTKSYISATEEKMDVAAIRAYLREHRVLESVDESLAGRS